MKDEDVVSSSVMLISAVSFTLQADNLPSNAALRQRGAAPARPGPLQWRHRKTEQTMAGVMLPWFALATMGANINKQWRWHTAPSLRCRQTAQAGLEQEETSGWMKRESRSHVICDIGVSRLRQLTNN